MNVSSKIVNYLLASIAVVFVLIYLKSVLIPFVFAFITWFLIQGVRLKLDKIYVIRKRVPLWLKNILSFIVIYGLISVVISFISADLASLNEKIPGYEKNLLDVEESLNQFVDRDIVDKALNVIEEVDVASIISQSVAAISSLLGNIFLVLLYVIFMIAESNKASKKVRNLFVAEPEKQKKVNEILAMINKSISKYISLKTIVSLITGTLSYVVLVFIGVDFAAFWAVLIFALNFIPTIGSLVATLFPAFMALLQFGEVGPFLWVLILIGVIQVIVGNFLEPKIMGDSLNISSLVVLFSLAFWGLIWGIEGMILCVPLTVILIIVLARFPNTRPIAILLSENGQV